MNPVASAGNHQMLSLILFDNFISDLIDSNNKLENEETISQSTHWEKIESYYVNRLESLAKEIESSTIQNTKLSTVKDELLQDILQLHQKYKDLNIKNELLTRSIAEKENHISAFMYNQPQQQQQQQESSHHLVGVDLVDKPCTIPSSLTTETEISTIDVKLTPSSSTSHISPTPKKENSSSSHPGLFRQISLRLSSKKRRQQEDSNNNNNAEQQMDTSGPVITNTTPVINHIDTKVTTTPLIKPLLHPAAVMASPITPTLSHQHSSSSSKYKSAFKR